LSEDPYWNNRKIRFQELLPEKDWHPVAFAKVDGKEEKLLIGLHNNKQLIFGFPFLDLIGYAHSFPPLKVGYYQFITECDLFSIEEWLVEKLVSHSVKTGHLVVQVKRWPRGFRSAFTLRHDYDRWISRGKLLHLLDYYQKLQFKVSWAFKPENCSRVKAKLIASQGHEITLHTSAHTFEEFQNEVQTLSKKTGIKPAGYTAHGGRGSAGFLGQTQYIWAESLNLLYGEIFKGIGLPSPVNQIVNGIPVVGRLVLPPLHNSLDTGMKPENHTLDFLQENLPKRLAKGHHVVLMNHPDIHIRELKILLERLDLSESWLATLEEVAKWCQITKFRSQVRGKADNLIISFGAPLHIETRLRVLSPGGKEVEVVCEKGRAEFNFSIHKF
jgi:hypothetical protein